MDFFLGDSRTAGVDVVMFIGGCANGFDDMGSRVASSIFLVRRADGDIVDCKSSESMYGVIIFIDCPGDGCRGGVPGRDINGEAGPPGCNVECR